LTSKRVAPSAERDDATATAFDPTGNGTSVCRKALLPLLEMAPPGGLVWANHVKISPFVRVLFPTPLLPTFRTPVR
jgi:hypothetical protein